MLLAFRSYYETRVRSLNDPTELLRELPVNPSPLAPQAVDAPDSTEPPAASSPLRAATSPMNPIHLPADGFFDLLDRAGDRDATSTEPSELLALLDGLGVPASFPDLQRQLAAYRYEVDRWSRSVRKTGHPTPPPRPPATLYAAYDAAISSNREKAAVPPESPPPDSQPAIEPPVVPTLADSLAGLQPDELLSLARASELTGVPSDTLQKAIDADRLPDRRTDSESRHLVRVSDLQRFLKTYRSRKRRP